MKIIFIVLLVLIGIGGFVLRTFAGMMSDSSDEHPWSGLWWLVACCLGALVVGLMMGCAYGQGYYLFTERHGYHFNPCQHYDWVKPQDRDFYVDECSLYDGWRQYAQRR